MHHWRQCHALQEGHPSNLVFSLAVHLPVLQSQHPLLPEHLLNGLPRVATAATTASVCAGHCPAQPSPASPLTMGPGAVSLLADTLAKAL